MIAEGSRADTMTRPLLIFDSGVGDWWEESYRIFTGSDAQTGVVVRRSP